MTPRRVHLVGIGGTGMGSLAGLLQHRGFVVTGSDRALYPPMSTWLERWKIPVAEGFRPEHVLDDPPDLVVVGNAMRPGNPEARAAIEGGLRVLSFPDALFELAIADRHSVVVAGTHGKTTTTALLGTLMVETGRDPSLLVGGIAANFDGSFRDGAGPHFVVEGDEYDSAFFDKTPKFLHYGARTLLLTSVEFDHADIYRDLEEVKEAFRKLVRGLPADGAVAAALAHPNVRDVLAEAPCRVVGYGTADDPALALRAGRLAAEPEGTAFDVVREGRVLGRARIALHGRHNVENALGALATAELLGVPLAEALPALAAFRGVRRRQEHRGCVRGIDVIDDFAHHPTAVRETVAALRARYPDRRLLAVFEPRTNTSRRRIFQHAYARAFDGADLVLLAPVPEGPIYSAHGAVEGTLSTARLAADLEARGIPAAAETGVPALVERLAADARSGDVVLVMSNGSFEGLIDRLLARLREA